MPHRVRLESKKLCLRSSNGVGGVGTREEDGSVSAGVSSQLKMQFDAVKCEAYSRVRNRVGWIEIWSFEIFNWNQGSEAFETLTNC